MKPDPEWVRLFLLGGAGSGIGRAAAKAFAREDASVVLLDRRPEKLEETASLIGRPERILIVPADVSSEAKGTEAVRCGAGASGTVVEFE